MRDTEYRRWCVHCQRSRYRGFDNSLGIDYQLTSRDLVGLEFLLSVNNLDH